MWFAGNSSTPHPSSARVSSSGRCASRCVRSVGRPQRVRDEGGGGGGGARDLGLLRPRLRRAAGGAGDQGAEVGEGEVRRRALHDHGGGLRADERPRDPGGDVALLGAELQPDVRDRVRDGDRR